MSGDPFDRQEAISDLLEKITDLLDPLLGPDLSVSTTDNGTAVLVEIEATVTLDPSQ